MRRVPADQSRDWRRRSFSGQHLLKVPAADLNTMTPSRFQAPPPPAVPPMASQTSEGAPPLTRTLFSLFPAKNPICRLSGDQKGFSAPSVSGISRASRDPIGQSTTSAVRSP